MPYPNRTHSISEGSNTTRHFYGLLTRYLNEHLPANPVRVVFETELGAITMETDVARAPISAANFLRYVDGKFYDGGIINRAVRPDNTVRHDVEVQVIQFQADPARENEMFPPIPMERTSVTGLRNVNGALSMARDGPETAQASFSIVIADQPEMDFGGKRNPDGQGFAVFGRVVDGWDVVKKIHQSRTGTDGDYKTETLDPPIKILKAYRKEQAKTQIHAQAKARDKAANGGIQRETRDIVSDLDAK
jgi:peptidyl-prolyl cis-trans isomerase A (cyclophilin A)